MIVDAVFRDVREGEGGREGKRRGKTAVLKTLDMRKESQQEAAWIVKEREGRTSRVCIANPPSPVSANEYTPLSALSCASTDPCPSLSSHMASSPVTNMPLCPPTLEKRRKSRRGGGRSNGLAPLRRRAMEGR